MFSTLNVFRMVKFGSLGLSFFHEKIKIHQQIYNKDKMFSDETILVLC